MLGILLTAATGGFDVNTIVTLIGSLGFPILCCLYLINYNEKMINNYRDDYNNLHEMHKQEINHLTELINNNTNVLQQIKDKLMGE